MAKDKTKRIRPNPDLAETVIAALEKWRGVAAMGGCQVIAAGTLVDITENEAAVVVGVLEEILR